MAKQPPKHTHAKPRTRRLTATQRGYDHRWRKARNEYISRNPLCVRCLAEGRPAHAFVVDHIIPHRGDEELMWDRSNWQSLCTTCHNRKTAMEDGGFGREPASA